MHISVLALRTISMLPVRIKMDGDTLENAMLWWDDIKFI
jgi:hypothetical protein